MDKKIQKFIHTEVKDYIDYSYNISTDNKIYKSLLYDLFNFINYKTDKTKNSTKIYVNNFENKFKYDFRTIKRHLLFLNDKNIIWMSKLEWNSKTNQRYAYRFNINYYVNVMDVTYYFTENEIFNENHYDDWLMNEYSKDIRKFLDIDVTSAIRYLNDLPKDSRISDKEKAIKNIYRIALKDSTVKKSEKTGRLYYSITNLPSELHYFLYFCQQPLSEIDAKNSQALLFSSLTKHINSYYHTLVKEGRIYEFLLNEIKNNERVNIGSESDDGYSIKSVDTKNIDRHKIKQLFYSAIFYNFKNKSINPVAKIFSKVFPEIANEVSKYDNLAVKLQRLESSIWLSASEELIKDYDIRNLTKHDSMFFPYHMTRQVKYVIKKHYRLNGIEMTDDMFNFTLNRFAFKFPGSNIEVYDMTQETLEYKRKLRAVENGSKNKDNKIYKFEHKDGTIFEGLRSEFINKYNLDKKSVRELIKGNRKSVKGWKIKY